MPHLTPNEYTYLKFNNWALVLSDQIQAVTRCYRNRSSINDLSREHTGIFTNGQKTVASTNPKEPQS